LKWMKQDLPSIPEENLKMLEKTETKSRLFSNSRAEIANSLEFAVFSSVITFHPL